MITGAAAAAAPAPTTVTAAPVAPTPPPVARSAVDVALTVAPTTVTAAAPPTIVATTTVTPAAPATMTAAAPPVVATTTVTPAAPATITAAAPPTPVQWDAPFVHAALEEPVLLGVKRRGCSSTTTTVARKRLRWTLPELQWFRNYLKEDHTTTVRKWVIMKNAGLGVLLPTRTGVDLKDCFRTMQKGGYRRQGVPPL